MATLYLDTLAGMQVEFEALAYSLGMHQPDVSAGRVRQSRKVATFHDLQVTKKADHFSPFLAEALNAGSVIDKVVLPIQTRDFVLEYEFKDCIISSMAASGSGYDSDAVEQISIAFDQVTWRWRDPANQPMATVSLSVVPAADEAVASSSASALAPIEPNTAFIIMWMDPERPELEDVLEAFKSVTRSFGIVARRADDVQHEDRITDVILNNIQKAEFLIADLTGERPNVFYEVGYAHAIGKRPILYRKEGSAIPFDLSVHNVLAYRNIKHLKELLTRRLQAITGRVVEETSN